MHPYQEICHLLRDYSEACDALDDDGALKFAMQIREAAQQLVVQAARNATQITDPHQTGLDL